MHHDHDLDLVSSLAEGTPIDRAAAEELIARCDECAALYRAHLTVQAAVSAEPPARLTDLERQRLRSSIWNELQSPTRPAAAPGWARWIPAAAVLAVVAGVGVTLSQLSDGEQGLTPVAAESFADADAPVTELFTTRQSDESSAGGASEDAGAPETTAAASTDTMEMYVASDGSATWGVDGFRERLAAGETEVDPEFDCDRVAEGWPIVGAELTSQDGREAWLVAIAVDDGHRILVVDRDDCSVIESHG
ncbi:MAG TPA: hypothetical protein VK070_08860 [Acidimicrobiia bacterium]|nr:hypothetical protein [Acidimicrobiia bacterium]